MLFGERKRIRDIEKKEQKGDVFWTDKFDKQSRLKLYYAFSDSAGQVRDDAFSAAKALILRSEGSAYLSQQRIPPDRDLAQFMNSCRSDLIPTVVEAMYESLVLLERREGARRFHERVGEVLRNHRVCYDFTGGVMVEFSSREIHVSVVKPTLQLLSCGEFKDVEVAYQKALAEISVGSSDDAITDAGTALQQMLKEVGCEGNSLGRLASSARKLGVLAPHDSSLLDGISKVVDWVSADRNTSGDAHSISKATKSDAWLIVHIVGAIILRLSGREPRP